MQFQKWPEINFWIGGKRFKTAKNAISRKKIFDLFDFTSFFRLVFFKFSVPLWISNYNLHIYLGGMTRRISALKSSEILGLKSKPWIVLMIAGPRRSLSVLMSPSFCSFCLITSSLTPVSTNGVISIGKKQNICIKNTRSGTSFYLNFDCLKLKTSHTFLRHVSYLWLFE